MNAVLAALSGLLLLLSVPKPNLYWLAPFALIPLLIATARELSPRRRFLLGWGSGILYWFAVCIWIQFVLEVHGGMGVWGSWGAYLLFALAKGLHLAVFALLAGPLMRSQWYWPTVPALWVVLERSHSTFGFMWMPLGNAAIDMGSLPLRIAPITGVYGISFLFALTATGAAVAILTRRLAPLAAWIAWPMLFLLPALPDSTPDQHAITVQPNIDTETVWNREKLSMLEASLAHETTRQASLGPAAAVLWPEMPAPLYFDLDPGYSRMVVLLTRQTQTPTVFGSVFHQSPGDIRNSVEVLSAAGVPEARYDKINLVPFGEFVPPWFSFVNRISGEAGDFTPGNRILTFALGTHQAGVFICYESVFPDQVRQFSQLGAEVLLNLSNDGYFGRLAAREQHLQIVRMRAVENGRWLLRSTNDGFTAAIDPAGTVRTILPPYRLTSARLPFAFRQERTIYTNWGDWWVLVCAVVAAVGLLKTVPWQTRRMTRAGTSIK